MPSVTGTTPEHYRRLAIEPGVIAEWEDGLRTDPSTESFEWWYFDCACDDGSKITVEFHTKPPNVSPSRPLTPFVSFTLDRADGTNVTRAVTLEQSSFAAARDRFDVQIGRNWFRGGPGRPYELHVELDDVVADLQLVGEVPAWRPETGHVFFDDKFVAWLPTVPRGAVTGTLTVVGSAIDVTGTGYHDHNWGNAPLRKLVDRWHWGRARVGDYTVLTLDFVARQEHRGGRHPALMVARGPDIVVSAVDEIAFTASPPKPNAATGAPVSDVLEYAHDAGDRSFTVRFVRERDVFALDFGRAGAYHRFVGAVEVIERSDGAVAGEASGHALWELLYFGARDADGAELPADRLVHQA